MAEPPNGQQSSVERAIAPPLRFAFGSVPRHWRPSCRPNNPRIRPEVAIAASVVLPAGRALQVRTVYQRGPSYCGGAIASKFSRVIAICASGRIVRRVGHAALHARAPCAISFRSRIPSAAHSVPIVLLRFGISRRSAGLVPAGLQFRYLRRYAAAKLAASAFIKALQPLRAVRVNLISALRLSRSC